MVIQLPSPYMSEVKGEVPNIYIVGLGAGYISALRGNVLIADSNAFQAFLGRFSDKSGIKFDKGLFSHELFREVFVQTLASFYTAYASARSQYLIEKNIPDSDLPRYTSFDNVLIISEFSADSPYENLDEILKNNKEVHNTALSRWAKDIKGILPQYPTSPEISSKQKPSGGLKEEKLGPGQGKSQE